MISTEEMVCDVCY